MTTDTDKFRLRKSINIAAKLLLLRKAKTRYFSSHKHNSLYKVNIPRVTHI